MAIHILDITADFADAEIHPNLLMYTCNLGNVGQGCTSVEVNTKANPNKVVFHFNSVTLSGGDLSQIAVIVGTYNPADGPLQGDKSHKQGKLVDVANINGLAEGEVLGMSGGALGGVATSGLPGALAIITPADGEIAALTEKETPVADDWVMLEDSESGNAKAKAKVGSLPGGGGGGGSIEIASYTRASILTEVKQEPKLLNFDKTVVAVDSSLFDYAGGVFIAKKSFDARIDILLSAEFVSGTAPRIDLIILKNSGDVIGRGHDSCSDIYHPVAQVMALARTSFVVNNELSFYVSASNGEVKIPAHTATLLITPWEAA